MFLGSRATSPTVPSTPFTRPYERVRSPSESPSISATPRHKRTRYMRKLISEKSFLIVTTSIGDVICT